MRLVFCLFALTLLSACDRGDAGIASEFSATVTGDVSGAYTGIATYVVSTPVDGAGDVIQITLDPDGDAGQSITLFDTNRQIQGPGSYPIGRVIQGGVFVPLRLTDTTLNLADPTFEAISGTLEITSDDVNGLDGVFTARIASGSGADVQRATIEGMFRARRVSESG